MIKELNKHKTQTQKIKIKPTKHSHSHSLSFYTSFFFVLSKSITCSVFVSLFFFFLFRSMTFSFSLKYQHLSVQHMAADAAYARRHGGVPCRDALQAIHSLQVLRHLVEWQGLLRHAPDWDEGFLHRRCIRHHQGRRWFIPSPPLTDPFSRFAQVSLWPPVTDPLSRIDVSLSQIGKFLSFISLSLSSVV